MGRTNALIVGLGNPGKEYEYSRHNLGFMVVRAFARREEWSFKKNRKLEGEIASGKVEESKVTLLLPLTYMNASGQAVRKVLDYYKVDLAHAVVVLDDINLKLGALRFRKRGGCGGHNGLRDIESRLGTREYQRLRIGIGDPVQCSLEEHVISPFTPREREFLVEVVDQGVDFLNKWLFEEDI